MQLDPSERSRKWVTLRTKILQSGDMSDPFLYLSKSLFWAVGVCWTATKYRVGVCWAVTKYQVGVGWAVTKYQVRVGLFICLYLIQFLTNFGQIFYSKSSDQA